MDKLIDVLTTAGIGSLFTLAGYGLKILVDYNFIKSPQILPIVTIKGSMTMPPLNEHRKYSYRVIVEFYNHSKNEAFGFELIKFLIDSPFQLHQKPKEISKNPITDLEPRTLELTYEVILPIMPGTEREDAQARLADLNKNYFLEISFKNALGKRYKNFFKGQMITKDNDRVFHVGW